MTAEQALDYLESCLDHLRSPSALGDTAIDTLRACVDACKSAEQTLRNLATGFLTGDGTEIAHNEARNLYNALKGD